MITLPDVRHVILKIIDLALGTSALLLCPSVALAGQNLDASQHLHQILVIDNERRALAASADKAASKDVIPAGQPEAPASVGGKHEIAILPQIGYSPRSGLVLGVKFSDIAFGAGNANLDIGATRSIAGDTFFNVSLAEPALFGRQRLSGVANLTYSAEHASEFYGLGNNGAGSRALSNHAHRETRVLFTLGYRLAPHWVAAIGVGFDRVTNGCDSHVDSTPCTLNRFPNLPGLHGEYNNPVEVSLLYNTQRDLTRPTHGWNTVVKVQHVGSELGNEVNYTRYLADISYVLPVFSSKNILGFRVAGETIAGSGDDLPFYEMSSIGGVANLEGFRSNRFRGQSLLFAQMNYSRLLADFDFYNIWRVRIDGALFWGAGRVFLNHSKLPAGVSEDATPSLSNRVQFSYGTGLRIALGEALLARIDVGFSKENKGQIYLAFGDRF